MNRTVRSGLAALALLACTACHPTVMGNGVFAERAIDVAAFDRLDVGYGFTVNVVAGASARTLVISGDENIITEYLTIEVAGSTLRIDHDEDFIRVHPITVHLDAPELVAVTAREGTRMTASGVDAAAFSVRATEGSEVLLSGAPPAGAALTATLDSGSTLDASAFPVASAAVALTSHSGAQLTCSGPVTGNASGGSSISVAGGGTCEVTLAASACTPIAVQGR